MRTATDYAKNPKHGCGRCKRCGKHLVIGPAVSGSPDVFIDGLPAVRVDDRGIHDRACCCGGNEWLAMRVVTHDTVYINGRLAFCNGDITLHDGTDTGHFVVTDDWCGAEMSGSSGED